MILILLSWVYMFFTAFSFGIALSKALRIQQFDVVITPILGLFSITVLTTAWAFFGPIAITYHSILLIVSVLFWFNNKETFNLVLKDFLAKIIDFQLPLKILLAASSLLILAQSATLPFIIDNESYYIQTIKWLNQYGFVKGLANLHLFLGQMSGWHITQSAYSFSFLYNRFNDLNGFCLLLGNIFAFKKLDSYLSSGNRWDLTFGLLPLTYAFLFQFVSSPSPDLPVYIFGFILFSYYLQNENKKERFLIIGILSIYAVFIKVTALVLLLFPLFLLLQNFKVLKKELVKITFIGGLVLFLLLLKNTMLTGYPLFPLLCFRLDFLDFTVPGIIMDYFFSKSMLHSFYYPYGAFDKSSVSDILKHYFLFNGMTGYIGIATVFTLLLFPIMIIKMRLQKSIWAMYFAFVILAVLLCFSSPQYRFYIYFSLFFWLILVSFLASKPTLATRLIALSMILCSLFVLVPMSFSKLTDNKLLGQNSTFHLKNILIPEPNSKWKPEYRGGSVGNMHYHSPIDESFFWVTGNGEIPCINTEQLDYFHQGFSIIPQQRSIDLKDGFYAQKVSVGENEDE
ncbi:MAG: hypothetical protein QM710_01130 [Flavobacterium sp.]